MTRVTPILRSARKALEDSNLLKVLQSEINYELSSNRFQNQQSGSLGDFTVDWDEPKYQDVVLRKKCESGEEVAVSALLGPETSVDGATLRNVLMKVCVKKPGLGSILQFDCEVFDNGTGESKFDIHKTLYLHSSTCRPSSAYRGPEFSTLDRKLQDALKEYLVARGIGESLTNFLLLHVNKKEQDQYVNWLQKFKTLVENNSR